jgi:2-iminobutanoate/2-iminopropanoate deaminase
MKKIISTNNTPQAIGPYSQAVEYGNLIFCSGQIALDPQTGELAEGGITAQTKQVMENLKAVVEAAGSSLDKVLKTTIYLTDLNNFQTVNEIYGSYFESDPPARATVGVNTLPKGAEVEIDLICAK